MELSDLVPEWFPADLSDVPSEQLLTMISRMSAAVDQARVSRMVERVRELVLPCPDKVVLYVAEWDNGFFFTFSDSLWCTSGGDLDVADDVLDVLESEFGSLLADLSTDAGRHSSLTIDFDQVCAY